MSGKQFSRFEKRHRSVGGNAIRAAVLGGNDGLVSNFSLIMGVAGATAGNSGVLLAGSAGLLAGALSMSLGEWISVKSWKKCLVFWHPTSRFWISSRSLNFWHRQNNRS